MIELFQKQIFTLKQLLTVTFAIIKSSSHELLYLASIPFLAYSFLSIYSGDGSIEAIIAIPEGMRFAIIFLYFAILLVMAPTIMHLVRCFAEGRTFSILGLETLQLLKTSFLRLTSGLFYIGAAMMIFGFLFSTLVPYFSGSSLMSMVLLVIFITIIIKLYLDIIFWSQFTVLKNQGVIQSFRSSRNLVKMHYGRVLLNLLILTLVSFAALNLIQFLIDLVVSNATVLSVSVAFFQSIFLIFIQLFTGVMFMNLTNYGTQKE
ncbi:MAG: hypothetical protein HGA49_12915 [Eubacteriaceae bacterium]|nr:hypothetical protein [Eubacteriaceae bacterium]